MTTFFDLPRGLQTIIYKAYEFEIQAIDADEPSSERNPQWDIIKAVGLVEALNEAVEMHYGRL